MEQIQVLFLVILIATILAVGCTAVGNPDNQFRTAWQNAENEVKAYCAQNEGCYGTRGINLLRYQNPARRIKVMIGTIDRNYDTISKIQVTSKYIQANNLSCIE